MNRVLAFGLVAFFALFLGSQITEGALLLPYWKSLSTSDFYAYYAQFGPVIGRFYTILTIIAALIPLLLSVFCLYKKSSAFKYALGSTLLAIGFVASFYIYFKGANEQFLNGTLDPSQLKAELEVWGNWHWGRVIVEFASLVFLVLSLNKLTAKRG